MTNHRSNQRSFLSFGALAFVALGAIASSTDVLAQKLDVRGVTDTFSRIDAPRLKTFTRASSDPNDFPTTLAMGNDDGFTGLNQVEDYRESEGADEFAVLTDIQGRPGFVGNFFRNFWGGLAGVGQLPFENTRAQIFVEGFLQHDLPLFDYFRSPSDPFGQLAPFDGPFTQTRAGGHTTFSPIVFEDSFKLRVFENWFSNASRFHRVSGTLGTWDDVLPVPDIDAWDDVAALRGMWPHVSSRIDNTAVLTVMPGTPSSISLVGPQTLLELTCTVKDVAHWSNLTARFTWDGLATPSVDVPLRVLGGLVRPEFSSPTTTVLFHNNGGTSFTTYFPMHFATAASLEFVNTGGTEISLNVSYCTATGVHPEPWGHFTATHDVGATQTGVAFDGPLLTDAQGMLRYVALESGITNDGSLAGLSSLQHLEGDLCVRINGNRGDDHQFAATETSIGHWGWYDSPSDVPFSADFSVHSGLMSRFIDPVNLIFETDRQMATILAFDPVHFVDGIDIVLEHGPGNMYNANYRLTTFMYVRSGRAREEIANIDVGDPVSEAAFGVTFTESEPSYSLTHGFFRDTQFGTTDVTDDVRVIDTSYSMTIAPVGLDTFDAIGMGLRLDRDRPGDGGVLQADVFVDGVWAGLVHVTQSNQWFRWKEGGETEVEFPRVLTQGKTSMVVELRPRVGGDQLRLARVLFYHY